MRIALGLLLLCAGALPGERTLDIHTIDVEGGKAVLIVSPSGESMLIDAGWAKSANREASTALIVASARAAGLQRIDYLVVSHYDPDHIGDIPALAASFPIRHLVDHGPLTTAGKNLERRYQAYAQLYGRIRHIVAKPGDRIPIKGVDVRVLTSASSRIAKPARGGGRATALCASAKRDPDNPDDAEDNASIGLLFTWGKFRMVDLADLESHRNYDLACPVSLAGTADVYHVNVHGQFKGMTPALLDALRPRVAIMGNGARKGGDAQSWPVLRASPGLEDIWQSHYSLAGGEGGNPPADFIANLDADCRHEAITVSARRDGGFTVTNGRNGFAKIYRARPR